MLTFKNLVLFIIMATKRAIQRELDEFYRAISSGDFSIRAVSKSAFSQARKSLDPEVFTELSQTLHDSFYGEQAYLTFDNMRMLAIDGSRLNLPRHKSTLEAFGEVGYGPNADVQRIQAQCSFLYDVLNLTVLDAQIEPLSVGEKTLAYKHLEKVRQVDFLLMDRGYPSIRLFFELVSKGVQFCVRMNEHWWRTVKEFEATGQQEGIVRYKLGGKARQALRHLGEIVDKELVFRIVCVTLDNGQKEYLCTTLADAQRYPHEMFAELYHCRWGVEEAFKLLKERIGIEAFTGKTAIAVRQDFHAKVFAMNMFAVVAFPIEEQLRNEEEKERKHPRKLNRSSNMGSFLTSVTAIFIKGLVKEAIEAFDRIALKTTEIVRKGRKNPRKHKIKQPPAQAYKVM